MNSNNLYYLKRPSTITDGTAPLLILLHGYGSDEKDLFSFAEELPEEYFIISLRAPYTLQPFGYAWYAINFDAEQGKWSDNEQAKQSVNLIANFIDEAVKTYPVNPKNVTLLGFSQGCILSYAIGLTYPEKVKNIVGLSGYINQDILPKTINPETIKHLEVYSSHGSVDQVIPVEWARLTKPFLDRLSIRNTFNEFPVGHGVAPQNFYEFRDWLKARL
jgi:phospholipase/carboxylesterase